jgi:hypothetical protein
MRVNNVPVVEQDMRSEGEEVCRHGQFRLRGNRWKGCARRGWDAKDNHHLSNMIGFGRNFAPVTAELQFYRDHKTTALYLDSSGT